MTDAAQGNYKLLIFDWDGTLCDSVALIVASMQHAIRQLEFAARTEDAIRAIIGLGMQESLDTLYPGISAADMQRLVTCYREYYFSLADTRTALFPGVEGVIQELHGQGYHLAVATGKSRRGLDRALSQSGLSGYIHASRCADETFSKPHPQMLQELLRDFLVRPAEGLMIGDTEHDLDMAKNAGMDAIAVSYGARSAGHLLPLEPRACIDCLTELEQYL